MSAHPRFSPTRTYDILRGIGRAVAAGWADCRYAEARMMQTRMGAVPSQHRGL